MTNLEQLAEHSSESLRFEPAIDALLNNDAWRIIVDTFRFRFAAMLGVLKKCTPSDLGYNQGQIAEIEFMLSINSKDKLLALADDFIKRTNGVNDAERIIRK